MRHLIQVIFFILLGLLFGPQMTFAQTLNSAMAKYQARDFQGAIAEWQALAKAGNADAQFNLGQVYRLGQGISFDFPKAIEFYAEAAGQGHTAAQRELGNLYFFTIGTDQAQMDAIPWLEQAAQNGDPKAQYILGILYFNGDVVSRDQIRGYAWTLLAIDGGVPEALQSNTAMRGQLSERELAQALGLAPTLMTGIPNQGLYSLLVGEPFPKPRTLILVSPVPVSSTEDPPPVIEDKPLEVEALDIDPLPSPESAEEMIPLQEKTRDDSTQILEPVSDPEVETNDPLLQDPIVGPQANLANEKSDEERFEETPAPQGPQPLDPEDSYDLGDPGTGLIDEEGFEGAWSIQLTSFRRPENAEAHWQEVLSAYPDLFGLVTKKILRFDLGENLGVYYRLRIGPFLDRAEAEDKCQAIQEAGLDCLVIWP